LIFGLKNWKMKMPNRKLFQNIKKSLEDAHSDAKIYRVSSAPLWNSTVVSMLAWIMYDFMATSTEKQLKLIFLFLEDLIFRSPTPIIIFWNFLEKNLRKFFHKISEWFMETLCLCQYWPEKYDLYTKWKLE
jgi:hypothetical protein